jgi:hypothetical protein
MSPPSPPQLCPPRRVLRVRNNAGAELHLATFAYVRELNLFFFLIVCLSVGVIVSPEPQLALSMMC